MRNQYKLFEICYYGAGNAKRISKIYGTSAEDAARSLFGEHFGEYFWIGREAE